MFNTSLSPTRSGLADPTRTATDSVVQPWVRWLFASLLAVMLVTGWSFAQPSHAQAGVAGTVNTEGVALMAGIDDQTVIDWMPAGTRVDVFWGPENDLYQVRYFDTIGWMWASFLDVDGGATGGGAPAESPASGGGSSWAVVTYDGVNVRSDASSSAAIVGSYSSGDSVEVTGEAVNGYAPIWGGSGWIALEFLSWDGTAAVGGSGGSVGDTAPAETSPATTERWIDVNAATGLVTLFDGDTVYAQYWASVGWDTSASGFYATATGTYHVYRMHQQLEYTEFADAYITDWVGFDPERFNGFHSWSRDSKGKVLSNGAGLTGGCVALAPAEARALYNFATIGMRVEVHR